MEVLLLIFVGAQVLKAGKAEPRQAKKGVLPTQVSSASRPDSIDAACAKAGLTYKQCQMVKAGDIDKLAEDAAKKLCEYLELPGCGILAAVLDSLGEGAVNRNNRLNGGCSKYAPNLGPNASYGGVPRGWCMTHKNGCRAFTDCPDNSKCAEGTTLVTTTGSTYQKNQNGCPKFGA